MADCGTPRGLYKRGNVYYSRIAGLGGKLVRKRLSEDRRTAIVMLAEMRLLPAESRAEEIVFGKHLKEMYVGRLRSLGRAPAIIKSFSLSWRYVVEEGGALRVDEITVDKAREFADRLKAKGTRGQTINHYVSFVKDALDWARDSGYIKRSPLARWEPVKRDSPRKRRDMTRAETGRFFASETDPEFLLRWMLYFRTGLRASAGINMEWEWILWDERALSLPAGENKSAVEHWIPLDDALLAVLRRRRDALPDGAARGPVFAPATVRQVRARFRRICKKADIDLRGLCLHSIRHTYATGTFEASGFNVKIVQKLLCHANAATTMKYIHASARELRSTNEEFAARFAGIGDETLKRT